MMHATTRHLPSDANLLKCPADGSVLNFGFVSVSSEDLPGTVLYLLLLSTASISKSISNS